MEKVNRRWHFGNSPWSLRVISAWSVGDSATLSQADAFLRASVLGTDQTASSARVSDLDLLAAPAQM